MAPLSGIRVIEMAALGAAPFGVMMLADMGAEVLRIERVDGQEASPATPPLDPLNRGRRSIGLDLKSPEAVAFLLKLAGEADVLVEAFRPGVMERLGLGPEPCRRVNDRLIYARMTGYGQSGPHAAVAGHDINYIALAGVLDLVGREGEPPLPPLNLVGDFGGGGMLLAFGVAAALVERARSGRGQVLDVAMVDGAALQIAMFFGLRAAGQWDDRRGTHFNDSGSHYYNVYETADGGFLSVGAIEPKFYLRLLELLGLDQAGTPDQNDRSRWPQMKAAFAARFRAKTLAEWSALLEHEDVCVTPVLGLGQAPQHPHNRARETFIEIDGVIQPAPAPRFERSPGRASWARSDAAEARRTLLDWGASAADVAALEGRGALAVRG